MTKKARLDSKEEHSSSELSTGDKPSGAIRISQPPSEPVLAKHDADYNMRIVAPLVRYVTEQFSPETLIALAKEADLDPERLTRGAGWMSWEQCEKVLTGVLALAGSPEKFEEACVYRFVESWGAFRYIAWALTPLFMYQGAVRANKTLANAEFSVETLNSRRVIVTYKAKKRESRLLCATRRVAMANVPTFFGLPVARLQERSCIAHGDDACKYDISWDEQRRWLPTASGALLGFGIAAILHELSIDPQALLVLPPLLGAAVGHLIERSRNDRTSVANTADANTALQRLMVDEAEARREILALGDRQREWNHAIEQGYTTRLDALQTVMKQAEQMQHARESTLLGFSHDLRNPLMVLASTVEFLRDNSDALGGEGPQVIEDVESSIAQMKRMLGDFVSVATSQKAMVRLSPQRLDVATLTASLTRRLRALVQGRPIVPSVMKTREAPEAIHLDPLVFDRVIDNLLTNAAKYTERGSIVVEVSGTPGFIVIKISDSGRGIAEGDIERIFQPGGSNKDRRARDSFGVGLSVILQLLEQVGGSLEVMSTVGRGTTFWANFPIGTENATRTSLSPSDAPPRNSDASSSDGPLSVRVRIRKPPA